MIGNINDLSISNKSGNYYMEQEPDQSGLFNVFNPSQSSSQDNNIQDSKPKGYFTKNKYINENLTDLGSSFYGQYRDNSSRFDDRINNLERLEEGWNINNLRAEQQSSFNKIMSGVAKGGVLALTTFAEGTVGLPFSIAAGVMSAIDGDNVSDVLYNSINNPFSNLLKQINDTSEELLPNYYTKDEEDSPWWDNLFTANFWGDKVLKVAGFTIGAAYSGKAWASGAAKVMGLNKARNAFEGLSAVGSDGKKLKSLSDKISAYLNNPEAFALEFTDELAKAANQLKKAEPILKWTGSLTGAIGEGKIEALNNSEEWFNKELNNIQNSIPQINQNIMIDLAKEYPDDFKMVATDYNTYEWQPVTQNGYNLLSKASNNLINGAINKLTQDRVKYANFDFITNLALLTLTDYFTFGKVYSGGYNTGSISKKALTTIDKSTGEVIRKTPSTGIKALMLAQTPIREGAIEEMGQSMLSDIKAQQYGSEINDYFKTQIDQDSAESTIDFIDALGKGFVNTYGNPEAWEEGVIGALMGLMGVPAIRKSNRSINSIPFQGGVWEQIANIKDYNKIVNEIDVDEMNQYLKDVGSEEKKKDRIQTIVSLQALEQGKQVALDNKDPKAYKDQENMQLIKLMQYFKAGGQLDLFFDKLESMGDVNDENIEEYKSMLASVDNFYKDAPKEKVKETIKKNVEDTQKKLKEYSDIADNLQIQVGDKFSIEGMSTLTYLASQIKDWDNRSVEILNELRNIAKNDVFGYSEQANNFVEALNDNNILNPREAKGLLNTIKLVQEGGNEDLFKQFLESPDGTNFKQLINDLIAIRGDRVKFINAYNKFINNPTLLNEELENTKKEVDNSIKKSTFNNVISNFNDATTMDSLQQAITDTLGETPSENDVMMFLDELKSSNAPDGVKSLGERYRNLMKTRYQFDSTLSQMNIPQDILQDVNKLIGLVANTTKLSNALLNKNSYKPENITSDPARQVEIMNVINQLLDKVDEINKQQVSNPKPKKFNDEEIQSGPQKGQFEEIEGIQQGEMPRTFMEEDEDTLQNVHFDDEGLELMPDFGLEDGETPELPTGLSEELPEQPNIPTEDTGDTVKNEIKQQGERDRQVADFIEQQIDIPVQPEPIEEDKVRDAKVVVSSNVNEFHDEITDPSASKEATNKVYMAIPEYDPKGFIGRLGKYKIFRKWKEILNKDSDKIIEDLSISEKDAYNIYEYLEKHGAFEIINKIQVEQGPNGTKFYIGYDPELKLSNGSVVPLIFVSIGNQIRPVNMVKIPKAKWRTDQSIAINKWLDIIQESSDKNTGTDPIVVNRKTPFYASFAHEGEILYNPQNTLSGQVQGTTADRFGFVYNGTSYRITLNTSQKDEVQSTVGTEGKHVLYVKTATGKLIATPLSSVPLYRIFATKGQEGKTPLQILKDSPKDSMHRQLYDAAKRIIIAENDGDYDQGFAKLSKIIRINYNAKGSKRSLFWDKTWINYANKNKVENRFNNPIKFNSYKDSIIKSRQEAGLPIDDDSITDVLIEQMLFNHDTGLISNTDPSLNRGEGKTFDPFTRLYINGTPTNQTELQESIHRLQNYTFTNVGNTNTVRRNYTLSIPENIEAEESSNDNNLSEAPVSPIYNGSVTFDGKIINYNISENGEVLIDKDVNEFQKNDLLNLIEATEYFKVNPTAKQKTIANKVYKKDKSGNITIQDKPSRPQPRQQNKKPKMVAGKYAQMAEQAFGKSPIGEISSKPVESSEFTLDNVMSDNTITLQILEDSSDELVIQLEDEFAMRFKNATITFEEFLEKREQNPNQDFECFGIIK